MRVSGSSLHLPCYCSVSCCVSALSSVHMPCMLRLIKPFSSVRKTAASIRAQGKRNRRHLPTLAGIRAVETYDGKFELTKESDDTLKALLCSEIFCKQVVKETGQPEGTRVEYTGILFQPVPWSPTTKKGMPQEFEKYHADPDYVMINIPPNFMFKAKVFKPSRLCAIFRRL